MDASCKGRVLLVGDGDFSFTLALLRHSQLFATQVTTSSLETEMTIQQHSLAAETMNKIKAMGAQVLLGVDAREVHNHPIISQCVYDRIIFNFPLEDRHNIKKNRALLADFFSSCFHILSDCCQIMVTLCKGQGGTPADRPMRSWHDSWQVIAMAANSGFILSQVIPFDATAFSEYHSVGFRFQDKSFNTEGSLTHIFEKAELVRSGDGIGARGSIQHGGNSLSCSRYVSEMYQRNLLQETENPVFLLEKHLKFQLTLHLNASVHAEELDERILVGHKSFVRIDDNSSNVDELSSDSEIMSDDIMDKDSLKIMKERKNLVNTSKRDLPENDDASFVHGVDFGSRNTDSSSKSDNVSRFIPHDCESVYTLVKNNITSTEYRDGDSCTRREEDTATEKIFHLRTSMLECLGKYCTALQHTSMLSSSEGDAPECLVIPGQCFQPCPINTNMLPSHHQMLIVHAISDKAEETNSRDFYPGDGPSANIQSEHVDCREGLLDFDACYNKMISCLNTSTSEQSRISRTSLPQSQAIVIEGIDQVYNCFKLMVERNPNGSEDDTAGENRLKNPMLVGVSLGLILNSRHFFACVIDLDIIASHICKIPDVRLMWSKCEKFTQQFSRDSLSPPVFKPFSLYPMKFVHDLSFWEISSGLCQRSEEDTPENTASSTSISESNSPANVTMEVTSDSTEDTFDELELFNTIRNVAGNIVVLVQLLDKYGDPVTGRTSRCYRLHFQSHDQALTYATSWKIQSLVRLEVAKHMNVQLR